MFIDAQENRQRPQVARSGNLTVVRQLLSHFQKRCQTYETWGEISVEWDLLDRQSH